MSSTEQTFIDGVTEALVIFDPETFLVLKANRFCYERYGYSCEELLSCSITDLWWAWDMGKVHSALTRFLEQNIPFQLKRQHHQNKHGSTIWVNISFSLVDYENKKVGLALIVDITDQVFKERQLTERSGYLEALLHNAPDAIVTLDKNHRILEWNPGATALFGYTPEEAKGKDIDSLIARYDKSNEAKDFTKQILSGGVLAPRCSIRYRKDGSAVPVIVSGAPIKLDRELIGVIAVYKDISEQKKAEKALKESEARYRMLAEVGSEMGQCVAVFQNKDGRLGVFRYVNEAVCQLMGYSAKDLYTMSFEDFVHPEYLAKVRERYIRRQQGEEVPPRYEILIKNRFEKQLLIEVMIMPLIYEGQVASIAFFKDITQERSLEEQLQRSRKLEAIGLLASGVAHNINTPLTAILGFTELLRLTYRNSWEIESIISQVNRIKQIVDNLMLKSSRDQEAEITEIDLNNLLETELNFFEANMHFKHNIAKEYQFDKDLPRIKGLYSDFSQSLLNIIGNATDAMFHTPKKELIVRTFSDNGKVCVQVKDTGEGIPPENIPHLMEPFFSTKPRRGENETSEPVGTGLGLYSAHQLLSKYDAKINIESKIGEGSTFTIAIPCQTN